MSRPGNADRAEVNSAAEALRSGGLVAIPTETVYGLAAVATDERAVRRVFEVKARPNRNPLIVHVDGVDMARRIVASWTDDAQRLADAFWPGPLTIVLPRSDSIPDVVTGGGDTVAVRCPDHPLALELIRAVGLPLVAPSANPSGAVSPTRAEHVRAAFPDLPVLDGGPCRTGIESTVVSLAHDPPVVLRPGVIGVEAIANVLGRPLASDAPTDHSLASPGMLPSHYAPAAQVRLVSSDELAEAAAANPAAVAIATSPLPERAISMPTDAHAYAALLYQALREADRIAGERGLILVERPERRGSEAERAVWRAVLDRLHRAAAPRSGDK